jgi:thymidylate synthase
MFWIRAKNVNDAYAEALHIMGIIGVPKYSRVGETLSAPYPVVTQYERPVERMLFDPLRDANPFFHIFEAVWMLAGRNDVKWISQFNSHIAEFSDDGHTFHGTYGFRWREHFGVDQIKMAVKELRRDKNSRRVVLGMWDPTADAGKIAAGRDVPCNVSLFFLIRNGALDMTVACRSNDIVWGCYGANAVHMSMLQEFIANAVGVPVGIYYQISNDWHIYDHHWSLMGRLPQEQAPYPKIHVNLTTVKSWEADLDNEFPTFIENAFANTNCPYIKHVLRPMMNAWNLYKHKAKHGSMTHASTILDGAVKKACMEWLERRQWKEEA